MDARTAQKIRIAVINDDVKALKTLFANKECFMLSFGRFPLLSLAYLYGSERVVRHYESALSTVTDYVVMPEETEDYLLFKKKAGKSLRLYLSQQTIVPIEMAAIMGNSLAVSTHLKHTLNTDRVKKIYRLTHAQEVKKSGNSIVVPRSKRPSMKQIVAVLSIIAISLVCLLGGVVALETVPIALGGEGTQENPLKITSPTLFAKALEDTSNRYYTLQNDITIDATTWKSANLSVNINGLGHTINIQGNNGGSIINKLSGSLSNATIKFTNLSENTTLNNGLLTTDISGKLDNIAIYVNDFSFTVTKECGIIAHSSTGTINNLKIFTNGTINEVSALEETVIGTLLYKNAGVVSNVEATLNISITGDAKNATGDASASSLGDAIFGGIVGLNNGTLTRATVKEGSTIVADTLDLAGISATNAERATITDATNNAALTQTTLSSFWSPNIGGITMRNYGKITSVVNNGAINASTNQQEQNTSIVAGGITTTNTGTIDNAKNTATISGTMLAGAMNLGGIGYVNEGTVTNSTNIGSVIGTITTTEAYIMEHHLGGAFAVNNGKLSKIKNTGSISGDFSVESSAYVGGLVGLNNLKTASVDASQSSGNITVTTSQENAKRIFVGGLVAYLDGTLTNSFNTGSATTTSSEKAVVMGGAIGFTMVQGDIAGGLYKYTSDWSNNYYVSDKGYALGIGNFYVRGVFTSQYIDGEDMDATPTDIDSLKGMGVYWE